MKKIILSFIVLATFVACSAMANSKTETFKVYGNCGMCKKTIEKALKENDIKGDWDKKTKMITVTYDSLKYTSKQVHEVIAKAGYDTEICRGDDKAYNNLHECCKYERRKN
jgi:mercuric ion binding protein